MTRQEWDGSHIRVVEFSGFGFDAVGAGGGVAAADDQPVVPSLRQGHVLVGGDIGVAQRLIFEDRVVVGPQQGPPSLPVGGALPDILVDPLALVGGEGVVVLCAGRLDVAGTLGGPTRGEGVTDGQGEPLGGRHRPQRPPGRPSGLELITP
jgi:hypothetical protein